MEILTLCMLRNFHPFIVVCSLFSKLPFQKKSHRITIRVSISLDPDQDRQNQIRTEILFVLIWVQTVCEVDTKITASKDRVKSFSNYHNYHTYSDIIPKANSVNPDQTAHISSLIWIYTVCCSINTFAHTYNQHKCIACCCC